MIIEKLIFLYALIGIYIGFLPMLDPTVCKTYNKAKEEFGSLAAYFLIFTSAFIVFLFWPFFLLTTKGKSK